MLVGQLALTLGAAFTGAAIYINIAEQPARLQLDDRSLLSEWKLAYKRGDAMQASLVIVGALCGLVSSSVRSRRWRWGSPGGDGATPTVSREGRNPRLDRHIVADRLHY